MQPQRQLLARGLGREQPQRQVGDLVLGIEPGPGRDRRRQPAHQVGDAVPALGRDHEGRGEVAQPVHLGAERQQPLRRHPVDLVDGERHRAGPPAAPRASRSRIARTPSVSPRCASISSTTTSASAAPPQAACTIARSSRRRGRNRPGVSTKHDLRRALDRDPADPRPRRLHLVGDDRDLRPDQPVRQRRLAGVRLADQRDEPAAGLRHLPLPCTNEPGHNLPLPSRYRGVTYSVFSRNVSGAAGWPV